SRTDITLYQAQHGCWASQVLADFIKHPTLSGSQREWQLGEKAGLETASTGKCWRSIMLNAQAHFSQAQLVGKELFHGQSARGWVQALTESLCIAVRWRVMQGFEAFQQRWQRKALTQMLRDLV